MIDVNARVRVGDRLVHRDSTASYTIVNVHTGMRCFDTVITGDRNNRVFHNDTLDMYYDPTGIWSLVRGYPSYLILPEGL